MIQQEDTEERRQCAQCLVRVVFGVIEFEDVRAYFREHGGDIRMLHLRDGTTRFVCFDSKGRIFDHFDFGAPEFGGDGE